MKTAAEPEAEMAGTDEKESARGERSNGEPRDSSYYNAIIKKQLYMCFSLPSNHTSAHAAQVEIHFDLD